MSRKSAVDPNSKPPSTLQRALAFCALLLLCALIYLLVNLQENQRAYAVVYTATPASTMTPKPTLPPGVSTDVFFSRLEEAGFTLENNDGTYLLKAEAEGPEDTLVLYTPHGYVQGFSLTLQEKASKKITSPKGNISKYLVENQQEVLKAQSARVAVLLPVLLAAMTEENEFPHSIALVWADEGTAVFESGKAVSETKHGISFAALRTEEDQLLLSADLL